MTDKTKTITPPAITPDDMDTCWVCDKLIPPGPDFCSPECETKWNQKQTTAFGQSNTCSI